MTIDLIGPTHRIEWVSEEVKSQGGASFLSSFGQQEA